MQFLALTDANILVSFDPNSPASTQRTQVTGVDGTLLGIDVRPANGLIYGLSTTNNLYTIDADSGAATLVSTLSQPFEAGAISGFDFNPVADRLRLVGLYIYSFLQFFFMWATHPEHLACTGCIPLL